jgi:polysaccharide biosynthesis transport protein
MMSDACERQNYARAREVQESPVDLPRLSSCFPDYEAGPGVGMPEELDQMLSSVENYGAIVTRRRWWILLTVFVTWAAVWGISLILPSTYQSEALILLDQQNVPNQYVVPNVNVSIQDRLQSISQQVLSRTRLQAIIDRFHLYPSPHGLDILLDSGDPIAKMRNDISIELVQAPGHPGEYTAFKMRYIARSPELAQQVNGELTAPFVKENVEAQQQLSENTTTFLENQLAAMRTKMEEQEAKVAAFKAKHLGEMPSQLEMNVQQILGGIQAQIQNSHQDLESARQHKMDLESQLRQYRSAQRSPSASGKGTAGGVADAPASVKELDKELMDLHLRLQDLEERYTDDHPDVVALKDKIGNKAKQKKLAEDQAAANPNSRKTATAADSTAMEEAQNSSSISLMQLENQLKANQREIENYQKRERDLESRASAYLARLNMAPEVEQELAAISRGYEETKANYNSLLQKQMQSQLATSLEQRQEGEQFRILDPPSLPKKHIGPNRFKFSLSGLALGIVLGFGIVAFLELSDIRIRREKDLKALVPSSVLIRIPRLSTQREEAAHTMSRWLDVSAVTIVLTLIAFGNFYAYFKS